MNKCILIGNLTKDPELTTTTNGVAVCRFSIAVKDGVDKDGESLTQFIPCIAWNNLAEVITDYVKKGDRIAIEGKINIQSYEDEEGENRKSFQIVVNKVHLVETKEESKDSKQNKRKR